MCVVCGCHENTGAPAERAADVLHYGSGPAQASVPGVSQPRALAVEQRVLAANDRYAEANRAHFRAHGVLALNLVSSPGAGKTTLLVETLRRLRARQPELALAVIEGDQQTSLDAERIRATGVPAIQVNTGKGCHLDARMVGEAFARLPLHSQAGGGVLFIENVGNLVCPALWDLGEAAKVAVLSITEGEDKPLKYADMFAAAALLLLNKIDLLPHVPFDVQRAVEYAQRVNPRIEVRQVSATTGAGLDDWIRWVEHELAHLRGAPHDHAHDHTHDPAPAPDLAAEVMALRARLAELEGRRAPRD